MSPEPQRVRISFGGGLTPIVRVMLWINGLAFVMLAIAKQREGMLPDEVVRYSQIVPILLGLAPKAVVHDWAVWQPITYMFLHQTFLHLFVNMFALWMFGGEVERAFGSRRFLRFYLFTGIGAGLTSIAIAWNSTIPTIGASGAVFGLLVAYGFLFPNREILLYFVLPVKAKYLVTGFAVLEVFLLISSPGGGVNRFAHLGGIVFALIWFAYSWSGFRFKDSLREWNRRRKRRRLRLIRKDEEDDSYGNYDKKTLH